MLKRLTSRKTAELRPENRQNLHSTRNLIIFRLYRTGSRVFRKVKCFRKWYRFGTKFPIRGCDSRPSDTNTAGAVADQSQNFHNQ